MRRRRGAGTGRPPGRPPLAGGRLNAVPPALVVGLLVWLALAAFFYALWPYRYRALVPVLVMTALGLLLGQAWSYAGLPSLRLGDADLLPGVLFATALQPVAGRLRLHRE